MARKFLGLSFPQSSRAARPPAERPPGRSALKGSVMIRTRRETGVIAPKDEQLTRTCLHCVIQRVLRREAGALAARGLQVNWSHFDAVWLPQSGGKIYRRVRQFVRDVQGAAEPGSPVKIAVLHDLAGKSHVEVTASFRSRDGWQALSCRLPRCLVHTLWLGLEGNVALR